jgi:integrase
MGISFDEATKTFTVCYSKRHPITRRSHGLRRRGIKSKALARRTHNELVIKVEEKLKTTMLPIWSQLIGEFVESQRLRGLTENTLYSDEGCLRRYTEPLWGARLCDTITRSEILAAVMEGMKDKADGHKKYVLKCIRAVFTYAVEQGYVIANPTPLLKFRMGEKIKPVLTENQARQLLEKSREMDADWYPHWTMALYTGMRNGELYALKWDAVDMDQQRIRVCRAWNRRDGFKDTKSGDDRVIDIAPALVPLTQDLYATRVNDFVLPRLYKWDKGEQARDLRTFLLGMGLPAIRFHDLRATWATILLSKGVEPVKVMKMGGWKDMDTMMIYVRKAGIDIAGALNGLNLHDHRPQLGDVLQLKRESGNNL